MNHAVGQSRGDAAAPLIAGRELSVEAEGRTLLDRVSLEIRAGEVVTIVGPNGGGKTTLLRALSGAARLSGGYVDRRPGLRIGFMPQKLAIDRSLPLDVDAFLALGARGSSAAARMAVLARLGVERLARRQMVDLSGGEFQRALLARALLREPHLLMLDEPTQALDHRGEARFYKLIDTLRQELGLAILLVSHDLHVVMGASDRVICLNGHVCCSGAPSHVTEHPEYLRLFGDPLLDVEDQSGEEVLALYRHDHDHAHDPDDDHQSCRGTEGSKPAAPGAPAA